MHVLHYHVESHKKDLKCVSYCVGRINVGVQHFSRGLYKQRLRERSMKKLEDRI